MKEEKLIYVMTKKPLTEYIKKEVSSIILDLVGFSQIDYSNTGFCITCNDGDYEIESVINGINLDFYLSLKVFESSPIKDSSIVNEYKNYLSSIESALLDFGEDYFNEGFLVKNKLANDVIIKNILKSYFEDYEMQNIIKVFLECDMNTSKASEVLYLHRNTMINKLDKFKEETGYDVKKFSDAFIIYQLL